MLDPDMQAGRAPDARDAAEATVRALLRALTAPDAARLDPPAGHRVPPRCVCLCPVMAVRLWRRFAPEIDVRLDPAPAAEAARDADVMVLAAVGFDGPPVPPEPAGRSAAILVLVRGAGEADEIALLGRGADAVVDETASDALVLARVRALARRRRADRTRIALGRWTVSLGNEAATAPGGDVRRLTRTETRILACLARAAGAPVASSDVLREVFGYAESVRTHTLETHVYRLRQKLEDAPRAPRLLVSTPCGYALRAGPA